MTLKAIFCHLMSRICGSSVQKEICQLKMQLKNSLERNQLLARSLEECNQQREDILKKYYLQKELASQDHLTRLLNRRGFEKAIHRQMSLIQRYTSDSAVPFRSPYMILLDLDKFKAVNDTHGHQQGDEVLVTVTKILSDVFHRDTDIVSRWGGDEFLIFLSNSTEEQAAVCAELLRKKIEAEEHLHFPECSVTASIGVTMVGIVQDTKPDEMDGMCQAAKELVDRALYHSKELGRNAVTIAIGDSFHTLQ